VSNASFAKADISLPDISLPTQPLSESEPSNPAALRVVEDHLKDTLSLGGNKVLLLEDDAAFKEIMTDFLRESGYQVMAVQNGVEGVHQVLASDFEVILCDMMMPTLPGDMFFRAVERMRPHLCDRFVFMTGHRGNPKVNDFINSVSGTVLTKPFHVDDLLEMIAFVRLRTTLMAA
jgi:DNA-binding response OmpR family regulator